MPESAGSVFDLLVGIMVDSPSAITADNYELAVLALNDFATAGSAGAMIEQKRDKTMRRSKPVKPLNTRFVVDLCINYLYHTHFWQ